MQEKICNKRAKAQQQNKKLQSARRRIIIQAVIAIQAIVVVVALIFGMSAAWYTNVLQTSGLQFEAEAWGFTGEIHVADDPIKASPGRSGVVGFNASNDSDDMIDVGVRVSKAQMAEPMQQRLFFYVDTTAIRNDEIMERVYVNATDSYTYTILSRSNLVVTEEHSNDAPLKWQWVYDMEGYYFQGTVTMQTNEQDETSIVTRVEDYLRPVEYDLDSAVFEDGKLKSVGDQTVEDILKELSEKDGYEQDITASDIPGYYKIDVDDTGYGVWVYLCNWAEIQQATTYDSQLGMDAANALKDETEAEKYIARLMVVGQMKRTEFTDVSTQGHLEELLNSGAMVRLQGDIELEEPLMVDSGEKIVLDLNGYSIQAPLGQSALEITNATNMIVLNGEIQMADADRVAVSMTGSVLTMSNVDITGELNRGVNITDNKGAVDSTLRLFDCNISADIAAVYINGNGEQSKGKTQVVIENCVLTSEYFAVSGSGNSVSWGTDLQINESTISGYYTAVYLPQSDSLTRIANSKLTGGTGMVIKGGDLKITGTTVEGIFTQTQEPKLNLNGFSDTGDALYVDCSYDVPVSVQIEGDCVFTAVAETSWSIRVFVPEEGRHGASVVVTGGKFDSSVIEFMAAGYEYDSRNGQVIEKPAEETEEGEEEAGEAVEGEISDAG